MRTFLNIVLTLVIVSALFGVGAYVYHAGVAQGLATSDKIIVPDGGVAPYPYSYGPFHRSWGFGFGLFGLIFPLLFFFLIFGLMRSLFFRGWRGYGPWGQHRDWPHGVPPLAEEWHRKMHEQREETKQL